MSRALQLLSVGEVSSDKEEEVAVTCLRRLVHIAAEELALIIGDVGSSVENVSLWQVLVLVIWYFPVN
jgi:hypothetical protein